MEVIADQTDPCTIVLDITIDEQQVSRTFDSVYREFSKYVNVPGFRPGKAPRPVLERFVNQNQVRERALEKLVGDTYRKAISDQNITPYRQPQVDPPELEDKKPYSFKAIVPLEPQVTLGPYTGLTIEKPAYQVSDAMIDRTIARLREGRARLERVSDRGVEPGDVLIAETRTTLEGVENAEPARRQLLQMGNNPPGFDEALLGLKPDEERNFTLTYPEDWEDEERRGKQATHEVKLVSISARRLPDLDDNFAKQNGAESVEQLREEIRQREAKSAAELSEEIAEVRLTDAIVNAATIHFPQVLVEEEVQDSLRKINGELRQNNLTYEAFLARTGRTAEQHYEELAGQAATRVRGMLALRQISEQEHIIVDDAAIDAEFERLRSEAEITEDQYDEFVADPRRRLQLTNVLLRQRLHDFLFGNNNIVEVQQPEPEASEGSSGTEQEPPTQ
jgi:trigger factor